MQRIRIKTAPKLGDQVDYSFYDSRYRNAGMGGNAEDDVKTTMGPVPREEASIEVERGEVVVGDTNKDGFLELFTFTGKPHSKGGTPVDVPAGSFIYSNTRKLRIKDEEVLQKVFGLSPRKGGYTPAEIAKKYQINAYVADLKNPEADNITKRSASEMLKNNLQKLSTLALIQESMKGFPDGIPAIAEMAASVLGVTPEMVQQPQQQESQEMMPQEMPQGRWGGLHKYQSAGDVKKVRPTGDQIGLTPATIVYINGKPHRYMANESQINTFSPNQYVFLNTESGQKFYIDEHSFNKSYNTSVPYDRMYGDQNLHYYIGESNEPFIGDDWYKYNYGIDVNGKKLNTGDLFFKGDSMYRVEWPYAARKFQNHPHSSPSLKARKVTPIYDQNGKITGYNEIYGSQTENLFQSDLIYADRDRQFTKVDLSQGFQNPKQSQQAGAADTNRASSGNAAVLYDPDSQPAPARQTQQQPQQQNTTQRSRPQQAAPARRSAPAPSNLTDFKEGGAYEMPTFTSGYMIPRYQDAGTANQETFVDEVVDPKTNRKVKRYKKGTLNIVRDAETGKIIEVKDTKTNQKKVYNPDGIYVYNAGNKLVDYEAPEVEGYDPKTYQNKYAEDIKSYESIIQGANNQGLRDALFKEFQAILNDPNSTGKIPKETLDQLKGLKQEDVLKYLLQGNKDNLLMRSVYGDEGDFRNSKAWDSFTGTVGQIYDEKGNPVNTKNKVYNAVANRLGIQAMDDVGRVAFQAAYRAANKVGRQPEYIQQFRDAGFDVDATGSKTDQDSDKTGTSYIDDFYGNNTSRQYFGIKEDWQPPEVEKEKDPGKKQAYYCVESEDGTRSVQTVNYDEGSSPVAPTGKKVTPYDSLEKAQAECQEYTTTEVPPGRRKQGPWWAQDIVNFAFESTRDNERFRPAKQQVDFVTPEWTTVTNASTIANNQGVSANFNNMAQNSADGNVALGAMMGNTGETLQNNALSDAQTNTVNGQTSTQAGQFNAQIENTERDMNSKYAYQYNKDLATEGQQNENSQNLQDRNKLRALMAGMTNYQRKKLQEQVKTPQVYIDPISYNAEFSGQGRDMTMADLYVPGYATGYASGSGRKGTADPYAVSAAMNSDAGIKAYRETFEAYKAELGEDAAKQAALAEMNRTNALLRSNPAAALYADPYAGYSNYSGYDIAGMSGVRGFATGGAVVTPDEMFRILIKRKTGR